jgi:hypothetical protein
MSVKHFAAAGLAFVLATVASAGTSRRTPFIDRQHFGEAEASLAAMRGPLDFVYDCFGPIFWLLTESRRRTDMAAAERLVAAILGLLGPGGTLFVAASDGALWLERLLERLSGPKDGLVLYPPRFRDTEIRICVLERHI